MSETGRWEAFRKCYYKCVQLTVALVGATLGTVAKRRVLVSALCFLCPINDRHRLYGAFANVAECSPDKSLKGF